MRRRESPYSQIETIRRSRGDLAALVLVTVVLGMLLNVLASGLYEALRPTVAAPGRPWPSFAAGLLITLALTFGVVLLYRRTDSKRALVEIWLPYHWSAAGRPGVAQRRSYQLTVHARRAFARRYPKNAPETQALAADWKMGWVPHGSTVWEKLEEIEARLEGLEMGAAVQSLETQDTP